MIEKEMQSGHVRTRVGDCEKLEAPWMNNEELRKAIELAVSRLNQSPFGGALEGVVRAQMEEHLAALLDIQRIRALVMHGVTEAPPMAPVLKFRAADDVPAFPRYATPGAACFDLAAVDGVVVPAGGCAVLRTGLAFEVPSGCALMIYSRSGHGFKHGLRLANGTGVIDSDYRGEVLIKLHNDSAEDYTVQDGERIAQAMLVQAPQVHLMAAPELSATERGTGGFGSTGA